MESIGIIGAGKLGLCLALNISSSGQNVFLCEKSEHRIKAIMSGKIDTIEPEVNNLLSENVLGFLSLSDMLSSCGLIFITVRTEGKPDGSYDCSQVFELFDDIASLSGSFTDTILVLNCNVNPGTTEVCQDLVRHLNLVVSYSPEWVAQGSIIKDQQFPDVIVIGHESKIVQNIILDVYSLYLKTQPKIFMLTPKSAELTKILLNSFLALKITFANFAGDLLSKIGEKPEDVLSAIGEDKRIGSSFLKYGFGYGGPCLPRDLDSLIHYSQLNEFDTKLFQSIIDYNKSHRSNYANYLISRALNGVIEIPCLSYKQGIDQFDFSEQLQTVRYLIEQRYKVKIKYPTKNQKNFLTLNFPELVNYIIF